VLKMNGDSATAATIQTVHEDTSPRHYRLLKAFEVQTGCSVLVNTSFNIHDGIVLLRVVMARRFAGQ